MEQMQEEAFAKTYKLDEYETQLLAQNLPYYAIAADEISGLLKMEDTIEVQRCGNRVCIQSMQRTVVQYIMTKLAALRGRNLKTYGELVERRLLEEQQKFQSVCQNLCRAIELDPQLLHKSTDYYTRHRQAEYVV